MDLIEVGRNDDDTPLHVLVCVTLTTIDTSHTHYGVKNPTTPTEKHTQAHKSTVIILTLCLAFHSLNVFAAAPPCTT